MQNRTHRIRQAHANGLLATLAPAGKRRVFAACEPFELVVGKELAAPGEPIRNAYFPMSGIVSLLVEIDDGSRLEVGLVGDEGMVGVQAAVGVATASLRAVVQGRGFALRIGIPALLACIEGDPALRQVVGRYAAFTMAQFAQTGGCTRFHQVGPRLARWLLMSSDRMHGDDLEFTHAFLAEMLGVRRAGVTNAAASLQRAGIISYRRGSLQILDRERLRDAACSCYGTDLRAYEGLMRPVTAEAEAS